MESAGLSLFFVGLVMHVMDTDIVLILMNALFIIPVISQFTREINALSDEEEMELSQKLYQKRRKIHIQNVILSSIAFIFQIIGIIGILYLVSCRASIFINIIIILRPSRGNGLNPLKDYFSLSPLSGKVLHNEMG